ncbi:LysE type translocator [Enhygromyxa salina]|uniref:LysE type translocator n=1 Tax=Enhygromyxa salina TaxID=215803 RepID=A0A2S9Y7L0_9BACT|nr:LysE family transporter [Enhygromyxa salina]PRQ01052.1 LysE type translocator [Enhygromyxa salina]
MTLATVLIVLGAIVLGIFSAIAPLGPVTVLVIQRAMNGDARGALRIGLGRVPAEVLYSALATFGITALLEQFPGARLAIEIVGMVVFFAVGVWLVVQDPNRPADAAAPDEEPPRRRWGDWSGLIISMLNPTLVLSWSAVVAIAVTMIGVEPSLTQKIVFPLGLGLGIALGYVILVEVLRRHGARIEDRFVRGTIRVMGVVFILAPLWNGLRLLGLV